MAVQWVAVCTQDIAPTLGANGLDCSAGTPQVVAYQYLDAGLSGFNALLNMSAADATEVSAAVVGVWLIAWGFKLVIKSLSHGNQNETE